MLRLIGFVVILMVVVFALGAYLDWFAVSKDDSGDTSKVSVTVDKEKVSQDTATAKEKVGEMVDKASAAAKKFGDDVEDEIAENDRENAKQEGTISSVLAQERRIEVMENERTTTFVVDDSAEVRLNGREVALADVKLGDSVVVEYDLDAGMRVAHRVSATRG